MRSHFPKSVSVCRPSKKDKHSQERQKGSSSSTDGSVISDSEEEDYGMSSEISSSESEAEEHPILDLSSNSSVCKDGISPSRSGHWKRKIGEGQAVKNLSCRKDVPGGEGESEHREKEVLPEGWNGKEVTLFRMLQPIFGYNYCSISKLIETKTCQQVLCVYRLYSVVYHSTLPCFRCTVMLPAYLLTCPFHSNHHN